MPIAIWLFCGTTDATVKYPWIEDQSIRGNKLSMPAAHPSKGKKEVVLLEKIWRI